MLRILKSDCDGMTGHIRLLVRVEERSPDGTITYGPPENIGIWPEALRNIHLTQHGTAEITPTTLDSTLKLWLERHHSQAILRKRHLEQTSLLVHSLRGSLLDWGQK